MRTWEFVMKSCYIRLFREQRPPLFFLIQKNRGKTMITSVNVNK